MAYQDIYLEGMTPKILNYMFVLESVFEKKERNRLVNYRQAMFKLKELSRILNTISDYIILAFKELVFKRIGFRLWK